MTASSSSPVPPWPVPPSSGAQPSPKAPGAQTAKAPGAQTPKTPESPSPSPVVIVMGVAGTGKTTVGREVARRRGWHFVDGDDYQPTENLTKMRAGHPLDDDDRASWLASLRDVVRAHRAERRALVLACSAIKASYRDMLAEHHPDVVFVYLHASPVLVRSRLDRRRGHFMPASLLESQLDALEPPADAISVDVAPGVRVVVDEILTRLADLDR